MQDGRFRYAANISIMFTEHALLDRPRAARDAGFDAIEAWWPFATSSPTPAQIDDFVESVRGVEVSLTGLNFYAGDMAGGERGVASLPDRVDEFRSSFDALRIIARATGCTQFNLLYGQLDPRWLESEQRSTAVENFVAATELVRSLGGTVLLEPLADGLNGAYPLLTDLDVLGIIDGPLASRGVSSVRLLFDVFHLGSNGVDVLAAIDRLGEKIGHVQIADAPGRAEPGTGMLPIDEVLDALDAVGYRGFIGCEYRPSGDSAASVEWIARRRLHNASMRNVGARNTVARGEQG